MFIEQWGGEVDFSNHEAKVLKTKQLSYVSYFRSAKLQQESHISK